MYPSNQDLEVKMLSGIDVPTYANMLIHMYAVDVCMHMWSPGKTLK